MFLSFQSDFFNLESESSQLFPLWLLLHFCFCVQHTPSDFRVNLAKEVFEDKIGAVDIYVHIHFEDQL
jgi:hypothetical protein